MIRDLVDEAVAAGARREKACEALGLSVRMLQRWRDADDEDQRAGPHTRAGNALSEDERQAVVDIATRPEFRGTSPKQIVPTLADRGEYVASESTFYRILRDKSMAARRGRERAPASRPSEHRATGPWQVASWDITYLKTSVKGMYCYLYLFLDVWSRKIIGWQVHDTESPDLAAALVEDIRRGAPADVDLSGWVLHSDNGGPMKGATMLATLERLGVMPSFSRPRVSDDNPFSEALFRTLKYVPEYPRVFTTIEHAREWVAAFVDWYNNGHLHSGIGYVTPASRHNGEDIDVLTRRRATYEAAKNSHPERWSRNTRSWSRPGHIILNPESGKAMVAKK
jgi:transposase InsO family protein